MEFIFADSLDFVDPNFDFETDSSSPDRESYWDDKYAHEILESAPYDGILVSRGIVGDHRFPGKYSEAQAHRFRRIGARAFLRFNEEKNRNKKIFGDCGAFSYHKLDSPPYSPEDIIEFYEDGQFTHGCSIDHIIFEFNRDNAVTPSKDAEERSKITIDFAERFIDVWRRRDSQFVPIGIVQGWSPKSMGDAAESLVKLGYDYLALGGMVPLNATSIHRCLTEVRARIPSKVRIHLLGFAKADQIAEFTKYGIASFDTTSPLIRAFKDSWRNYYINNAAGGLEYFSAIRVPQAVENTSVKRLVREGLVKQDELVQLEAAALRTLRSFDRCECALDDVLNAVLHYQTKLSTAKGEGPEVERRIAQLKGRYRETLAAAPWKTCPCEICRACGIEVIIFRSSNRNKRRGIHNLQSFYKLVTELERAE